MMWSTTSPTGELFVWHNGQLVYKRWPTAQPSRVFNTDLPDVILPQKSFWRRVLGR